MQGRGFRRVESIMLALVIIIAACFAAQLATVATLFLALIANAAILVVAASAFHATGHTHVTEIQNDAHRQRQAEQEMQRQRAAQHLGEIGPTARRRAAQRRCRWRCAEKRKAAW